MKILCVRRKFWLYKKAAAKSAGGFFKILYRATVVNGLLLISIKLSMRCQ